MDVLLINHAQLKGGYWKTASPPLGMAYIASVLEEQGIDVDLIDMDPLGYAPDDLLPVIKGKQPVLVGVPATVFDLAAAARIAEIAKEASPGSKTVIGGCHPTLFPEDTLERYPIFDFLIRGEAEYATLQLIRTLKEKNELEKVPGLCFRKNGKLVISHEIQHIEDLDALPFPAYHLLPMRNYFESSLGSKDFTGIITSRGCPFKCIFCSSPKVYGHKFRARSAGNVLDEIELLQEKFGIRQIVFWDDTFTINKKRVIDICKGIIERDTKIGYRIRSRVDVVDEEMLVYLKKSGCEIISYGVESGDDEVLKAIKKGINLEQVRWAFKITKEAGIGINAYFMIGMYCETKETILKTIKVAKELDPEYATFFMAAPLPGSEFFNIVKREASGHIFHDIQSLDGYHRESVMCLDDLSKEELLKLQKRAYREFYLRPHYVIKYIRKMKLSEIRAKSAALWYLVTKGIFSIPKEL